MADALTQALMSNVMDRVSESISKHQESFFQENPNASANSQENKLFKNILLFKNDKISTSAIVGSTTIWLFLEWVNYHFISLVCYAIIAWMLLQFFWKSTISALTSNPSQVPRIVLSEEVFANMGRAIAYEVNSGLNFFQDVACAGNRSQFLMVIGSLLTASGIASTCNFLTMIYMGFISAHTMPVLYLRYEDQITTILSRILERCQNNCNNIEEKILSRLPSGKLNEKKED